MSKIPFNFDLKPSFFRNNGWFKPKKDGSHIKRLLFIDWAFSRCWATEREVFHDNKMIKLKPYQFIFGRRACSEETGLTEMEIRTQQNFLETKGFIKRTTNRGYRKYTVYEWVTEAFSETIQRNNQANNQANNQQNIHSEHIVGNKNKKQQPSQQPNQQPSQQPTDNHNTDIQHPKADVVVVVVGNAKKEEDMQYRITKKTPEGDDVICIQEEFYAYAVRTKKPWTTQEIDEAWQVLIDYPAPIRNWLTFMDGIIKKNNTLYKPKITKKTSCKTQPLNPKSEKLSDYYSAGDTKESPLAKFERQMRASLKS